MAQGRFRADLLYRLNVYPIRVPALRERPDDIEPLAKHLLQKFSALHGKKVAGLSDRALAALRQHQWPGNVRELENLLERGLILAPDHGLLDVDNLFPQWQEGGHSGVDEQGYLCRLAAAAPAGPKKMELPALYEAMLDQGLSLQTLEERLLLEAVRRAGGNLAAAARALGLTRPQLSYRLARSRDRAPTDDES